MITHEEARENALLLQNDYDMAYDELLDYISQQEALQAEHEALKKDIARFFELDGYYIDMITDEYSKLRDKLSRVGKEK